MTTKATLTESNAPNCLGLETDAAIAEMARCEDEFYILDNLVTAYTKEKVTDIDAIGQMLMFYENALLIATPIDHAVNVYKYTGHKVIEGVADLSDMYTIWLNYRNSVYAKVLSFIKSLDEDTVEQLSKHQEYSGYGRWLKTQRLYKGITPELQQQVWHALEGKGIEVYTEDPEKRWLDFVQMLKASIARGNAYDTPPHTYREVGSLEVKPIEFTEYINEVIDKFGLISKNFYTLLAKYTGGEVTYKTRTNLSPQEKYRSVNPETNSTDTTIDKVRQVLQRHSHNWLELFDLARAEGRVIMAADSYNSKFVFSASQPSYVQIGVPNDPHSLMQTLHEVGHFIAAELRRQNNFDTNGNVIPGRILTHSAPKHFEETESTTMEIAGYRHLAETMKDKPAQVRLALKMQFVLNFINNTVRQALLNKFEVWAHSQLADNPDLSLDQVNEHFNQLMTEYLGDVESPELSTRDIPPFLLVPHFRQQHLQLSTGAYSMGFVVGLALQELMSQGKTKLTQVFEQVFSVGGSQSWVENLTKIGVNPLDTTLITKASALLQAELAEISALMNEIDKEPNPKEEV